MICEKDFHMSIKDLVRRKKSVALTHEESNPFALFRTQLNQLLDNFWGEWPTHLGPGLTMGAFVPKSIVA